jgi:hypothetical protein
MNLSLLGAAASVRLAVLTIPAMSTSSKTGPLRIGLYVMI